MKQMVFVVTDESDVIGVYNEYSDADEAVDSCPGYATITPVIVDQKNGCWTACENPEEVIEAMTEALQNL